MTTPFTWVKRGLCLLVLPFLLACNGLAPQPTPLPPGYTVSGRTIGDPNAKVTLVEFADFQ